MDIELLLRSHRKALVLAAEAAIEEAWTAVHKAGDKPPEKSQLNRLISICGEATCAEEIISYLRYQASRKTRPWPPVFADMVIAKIEAPLGALIHALREVSEDDRDRARVVAWRLYAVFLVREFTYVARVRGKERPRP